MVEMLETQLGPLRVDDLVVQMDYTLAGTMGMWSDKRKAEMMKRSLVERMERLLAGQWGKPWVARMVWL